MGRGKAKARPKSTATHGAVTPKQRPMLAGSDGRLMATEDRVEVLFDGAYGGWFTGQVKAIQLADHPENDEGTPIIWVWFDDGDRLWMTVGTADSMQIRGLDSAAPSTRTAPPQSPATRAPANLGANLCRANTKPTACGNCSASLFTGHFRRGWCGPTGRGTLCGRCYQRWRFVGKPKVWSDNRPPRKTSRWKRTRKS